MLSLDSSRKTPRPPVDVIIPTYDNVSQLQQCVDSILRTQDCYPVRVVVVNNGEYPLEGVLPQRVVVLNPEGNKGWTGGLKVGLAFTSSLKPLSPYMVFMNDDAYIPISSISWLRDMVRVLDSNPLVGAIGPSSNCVSGSQNIWGPPFLPLFEVPMLIGFCKMVRREALEKVGGIKEEWVHGDDLDLSLRLREGGYALVCLKSLFIYHHGFQTGEKLFGGSEKEGGWNSRKQVETTQMSIIKEHGFLRWWETLAGGWTSLLNATHEENAEGILIRKLCGGIEPSKILDIGCGDALTVEGSFGVDRRLDGVDFNLGMVGYEGEYDAVIARHILEHLDKPDERIKEWLGYLGEGGKLFLCCPNEDLNATIPMDPTHKHAFSPSYLKFLVEACGGQVTRTETEINDISFLLVVEKPRKGEEK